MFNPSCIAVSDLSQVGAARRAAAGLAQRLHFDEQRAGELSIVVTEAANNLVRHATGGEIILRPLDRDSALGIEMLAIDKGPGIRDLSEAFRDGYSTGGTPGTGLGAMRRMASEFDIFSNAEAWAGPVGTVVMCRSWNAAETPAPRDGWEVGVVSLPVHGEEACGDAWAVIPDGERVVAIIADGLGHGVRAGEASSRAIQVARDNAAADPMRLMEIMHTALRSTRGAAVSIVELRPNRQAAQIVGVGNVSSLVVNAEGVSRNMTSHNGTVGVEARRIQAFPYEWPVGSTLIMHSDGVATQWNLARYPGLIHRHAAVIAGVLYRDHRRVRDDTTTLVVKPRGRGSA